MQTAVTNTQTALDGQNVANLSETPHYILGKIEREIGGARAALDHTVTNLVPELRSHLAAPINAVIATVLETLTALDPRGADYGLLEIRHYSDDSTSVLHRKDGYALSMETRFFKRWAGTGIGRLIRPVSLADLALELNKRGLLSRVDSGGHPGASDFIHIRIASRQAYHGGTEEWHYSLGHDETGTWTAAFNRTLLDDKGREEDSTLLGTLNTGVAWDCDDAGAIADGFLAQLTTHPESTGV